MRPRLIDNGDGLLKGRSRRPAPYSGRHACAVTDQPSGPAGVRQGLVVLPTYNERENLERAVSGILSQGHDVLVVDDASPDGTGDLADRLAECHRGVQVLHRSGKLGLGTAYIAGFSLGLERGYRFLFTMDADGSHDPVELDRLLKAAQRSGGLAIGSRYVAGGKILDWPLERRLLSKAANTYCRAFLGLAVSDWTSGFRCYSAALLRSIGLDEIIFDGYSFQVEIAFRSLCQGFPIIEIPIIFRDRIAGESKVCSMEVREGLLCVLRLRATSLRRRFPDRAPTAGLPAPIVPQAEIEPRVLVHQ